MPASTLPTVNETSILKVCSGREKYGCGDVSCWMLLLAREYGIGCQLDSRQGSSQHTLDPDYILCKLSILCRGTINCPLL
jgi:hypothetical protein